MNIKKKSLATATTFSIVLLILSCNNVSDKRTDSRSTAMTDRGSLCEADTAWFAATGTPEPSNANPDTLGECGFYKWAWHAFLFITQPDKSDGRPLFLHFESPSDLFGHVTLSRFMAARPGMLLLTPQMQKDTVEADIDEFEQAGSNEKLIDQDGRVVYYAQHVNSRFVKFIQDSGYTDMNRLVQAPDTLTFPPGSIELKSSWKIVPEKDVAEVSKTFFTTKALVPFFILKDSNIIADLANPPHAVTVALLGLHVVGVVDGHPEFIWSTFEHDSIAPDLVDLLCSNAGTAVNNQRDYILYKKGSLASECNKQPAGFALNDPNTQVFTPRVSIDRSFPFADELIIPLNASVKEHLPAGSVWSHYSLMGAVWMQKPGSSLKPNRFFKPKELIDSTVFGGERELSNVTMETFTQSVRKDSCIQPVSQKCFSCHRTTSENEFGVNFPPKDMNISHIILKAYFNSLKMTNTKKMLQQKALKRQ